MSNPEVKKRKRQRGKKNQPNITKRESLNITKRESLNITKRESLKKEKEESVIPEENQKQVIDEPTQKKRKTEPAREEHQKEENQVQQVTTREKAKSTENYLPKNDPVSQGKDEPKLEEEEGENFEQENFDEEENIHTEKIPHFGEEEIGLSEQNPSDQEKEAQKLESLPTVTEALVQSDSYVFDSLQIHENTKKAISDMGFKNMTQIQASAIPHALLGRDILASAKTGSGKTLAYLIPAVELLLQAQFKARNGTAVLIIAPTRELAIQIYGVTSELLKYHESKTFALVTGGVPKFPEEEKLKKGVNILIGTPGRVLDHILHTEGFSVKNLKMFIVDEVDRLLEEGFEDEINSIVKALPKERQTMLFSATQTRSVQDLARLSLEKKPFEIHVEGENKDVATVEGLEQGYVVCDADKRFLLLFTFLKRNATKKIMVFFSSCASVKYHSELLNYIDVPVLSLHGKQKQKKRAATFFEFKNAKFGILLSTDVAARGLDIPQVDWIIQFDPPDDPKEYIHRVGRTARGINGRGKALLFLLPSELLFLKYLKQLKIPLEEFEFPHNKIANIQSQLEKLVSRIHYLNVSARDAYNGYIRSYASHSLKDIYDVSKLDLAKVAKSLGLDLPPRIDNIMDSVATGTARYNAQKKQRKNSGGFSADNPYGKRKNSNDKRQFVY